MKRAEFNRLTEEQQKALVKVFQRPHDPPHGTFDQFLANAVEDKLCDCVMVPWAGMWLGIEPDGHTHS